MSQQQAMNDWSHQVYFEDVTTDTVIDSLSIPVTLQRLVMEAGSNRDLSLIHHDTKIAQATGAPDAYANTFFMMGMFERMAREWMGLQGKLKKISSLRMMSFNCAGDVMDFHGTVTATNPEDNSVTIGAWIESSGKKTVTAELTVILPSKT